MSNRRKKIEEERIPYVARRRSLQENEQFTTAKTIINKGNVIVNNLFMMFLTVKKFHCK
jgi:hypothetical protein